VIKLAELGLAIKSPLITPSSPCFRPPSWPPPRDWVVVEDSKGNPVSFWGDSYWRLDPWANKPMGLNFGDGAVSHTSPIDSANADILRLLVTWRIWGMRGIRNVSSLINGFFTPIRKIIALCSSQGILASDLVRFPAVIDLIPNVLAPSNFDNAIAELYRLLDAEQTLGFVILDHKTIKKISSANPNHLSKQTPYIPPRIWNYQVNRLEECLNDYLEHREKIENCFEFVLDAYADLYGSITDALMRVTISSGTPFQKPNPHIYGRKNGFIFHGSFAHVADKFGLSELLGRWVGSPNPKDPNKGLKVFATYLSLVKHAGLAYITNFSLMRIDEVASLRTDCLYWENDDKFGRIPILCGKTTKTDSDSDARWPTSPSVQIAVYAMTSIARMQMRCASQDPRVALSNEDVLNPYLFEKCFEPWTGGVRWQNYSIRHAPISYKKIIKNFPLLFDEKKLQITEDDLKVAKLINPTLDPDEFQVGKIWVLAWHQLRRTSSVNMFASGLVSDSSMQYQLKHASRNMSLYYGQGHSKLCLNESARVLVINAMYEILGRELLNVLSDRFVSPYGDERKNMMVVNLISQPDAKRFEVMARKGEISFRNTRLGGCMKRGACSYGGIESIAHCAGGEDDQACVDALFDKEKAGENRKMLERITRRLEATPPGTPLHRSLEAEKHGLENYFDVIKQK